ncbi:hypothetical protein GIB67_034118 [Kingdonia uniflora]|uniref:Protein kinase domain-containing protein n=1 Tax=Kingdonia uniflora TaxID=39325 RepID=A0A7J7NCV5_9MAGN|nr:hypothetical protein GIB67_034118 [Kingdonia uniflora]
MKTCGFSSPYIAKYHLELKAGGVLVQEITLDSVYVGHWKTSTCYSERESKGNETYNLKGGPFSLSSIENKLTAIGCDIYAYITDADTRNRTSGCISLCEESNSYNTSGSCSGSGCCQTNIPTGMTTFEVGMISINTENKVWNSSGDYCSTAMIEEGLKVDRGIDVYEGSQNYSQRSGLEWWIGNETCERATWNDTCNTESRCYNSTYGQGYRCYCTFTEFKGNPYLPNGCPDPCDDPDKRVSCFTGEGEGKGRNLSSMVVSFIAIGGGVFLLTILAFWIHAKFKKRKNMMLKRKFFKRNGGLLLEQQISSGESNVEKTKIFVQEELMKATDNFNDSRVLGRGGSGTVYKGMLPDGRIVAIKKSKIVDESQIGQFINELVILSQINHRHIVKVLGCCLETEVPLLVYEFVSNGTLSEHLHKEEHISSISWEDRLRISKEIAGALAYLHSSASTPIFHRDIKSSNILLDENYKAKVSDFGISRSVPDEKTHLSTLVQGTFGYLDPEYFHSGQFTEKSDVYSFGVVLLELLTGQRPVSLTRSEEEANLAMNFISSVKEDRVFEVLETRVANEARKEEIQVVASLAKKCLKLVGKKRPTMKEVLTQLENLILFQRQEFGYLCECSPGYEGNPYLPDGCHGGFNCSYQIPKTNKGPPMVIDFTGIGTGMLLLILLAVAFWKISIEELERATDNFNESRILGRGGSGTVYKGMLPDGRIVAIKKSKLLDETQIGQFINKLVILSEIKHRNIVQVMGCCLETEVPLLVYEFVSRGTLSEHRHDISLVSSISGEDRLRISKVIAGALSYLHSSVSTPIFHRDIKSSNILLDENFKAKYQTLEFQDQYPTSK